MKISRFEIENYRNIHKMEFMPCPGVNIIFGDNAQGKTNLIESIWLFTGAKSFRGSKDTELIRFDADIARLNLDFVKDEWEQCASIVIPRKGRKDVQLNYVSLSAQRALAGEFYAVIFSPVHLSLVKDGPEVRRRFLDLAIGQLMPRYVEILSRYTRVLKQRNALLKDLRGSMGWYPEDTLEVFDDALAKAAVSVIRAREKYISRLQKTAGEIYQGISREHETMTLEYLSGSVRRGNTRTAQSGTKRRHRSGNNAPWSPPGRYRYLHRSKPGAKLRFPGAAEKLCLVFEAR